ncbi:CPXCG motif-containing cysteine-rich protein [Dongshaea marina]|uniref:CPXCG motif-containing cysteine-rich protein n=1 Tax=Dongshaea marina TaxID=2047966 RepID=UPI000D3EA573|nr:CPXCG motif-containing cysteine-rich protein [Dongshaea marina]
MRDHIYKNIICPHCGCHTPVELDATQGDQDYHEECMACYNTIHLVLHRDELHDRLQLFVDADDEQIF